jgi:MFS family permease
MNQLAIPKIKKPSTSKSPVPDAQQGKWQALVAAWLGEAFDALDATIFFIAMYPAMSDLINSKNDAQIGWYGSIVVAVFMLGWAVGGIGFGMVADRIGRAKTMVITILIYALATGLCAISHSWQELACYRFLVGVGVGGEIGLGCVLVSEAFKTKASRIWAIATVESSFCFGVMGCAAVNALLGPYGWRWLFVAGLVPAFFALYFRLTLKESESFEKQKRIQDEQRKLRPKLTSIIADLPLVALLKSKDGGKLWITALCATCAVIGWWGCISWISPWINQLTGTAAVEERSLGTTLVSIGNIVGCFTTPLLLTKFGRARLLQISFLGCWLSATMMFLTVKTFGLALLAWCFVVGYFGIVQFVVLVVYIPESFSITYRASASGFTFGFGRILAAGAAIGGGHLIGIFGGSYAFAAASIAIVYLMGMILSLRLPETDGTLSEEETDDASSTPFIVGARTEVTI